MNYNLTKIGYLAYEVYLDGRFIKFYGYTKKEVIQRIKRFY